MQHMPPKAPITVEPVAPPTQLSPKEKSERATALGAGSLIGGNSSFRPPAGPDTSFIEGAVTSFGDSGIVTGAFSIDIDIERDDPDYTHPRYFENAPEDLEYIQPYLDDTENPLGAGLFESLKGVRSDKQAARVIEQHRQAVANLKSASEAPWGSFFGMLGGIGLDVAATIAVSYATGGLAAPAAGGSLVRTLGVRGAGALRVGAFGAVEGAAERSVQSLSNPLIDGDEIALATALGAMFGAGLGALFPHAVGGVARPKAKHDIGDDIEDVIEELHEAKSAGAAATKITPDEMAERIRLRKEEELVQQARGGGTPVVRHIPLIGKSRWIGRNPKRRMQDEYGAQGRKDSADGYEGTTVFFDAIHRILRMTTVMEGEVGGKAARNKSFQDFQGQLSGSLAGRNAQIDVEYNKMLSTVYKVKDGVAGILQRASANSKILSRLNTQKMISKGTFQRIADEVAYARSHNAMVDAEIAAGSKQVPARMDVELSVPDHLLSDLSSAQHKALVEAAGTTADGDDLWWKSFQSDLVGQKLLDPEDVMPSYRPQVHNVEAMKQNTREWKNWIRRVFRKEPDREWVNDGWSKADDSDAGEVVDDFWKPEESWADYAKRMPDEAEEIMEEWDLSVRRSAEDKAYAATEKVREELDRLHATDVADIETRYAEETAKGVATIDRARRLLEAGEEAYKGKAPWAMRQQELARTISKAEGEQAMRQQRLVHLRSAMGDLEELQLMINRIGKKGARKKSAKKLKTLRKRETREGTIAGGKLVNERIDDLYTSIVAGNNVGRMSDLAGDRLTQGNSRLMRRQINLGVERQSDEARKFLVTDSETARRAYVNTVGARMSLRKAMEPVFRREGYEMSDVAQDQGRFKEIALEGFDKDIAKAEAAGDTKLAARFRQDKLRADQEFDGAMAEINRTEIRPGQGEGTAAILQTTAVASLGTMITSTLPDLAMLVLGGSKMSTGFKSLFSSSAVRQVYNKMIIDEPQSAAMMMGVNVMEHNRWQGMAGVTDDILDQMSTPGSRLSTYRLYASEVGHVQAMATFMNYWNRAIRGAFGHDFMRQMVDDFGKYDSIPELRKTFYSRMTIDRDTALKMHELMERAHKSYGTNGALRVPDSDVWAREAPELLERWHMAVKAAGDETLLDPSFSDMPWLRTHPWGKLIMQFSSFMFTASERMMPRLTQGMVLHPEDAGIYVAITSSILLGHISSMMKASLSDSKTLQEELDRPFNDQLWDAIVRSPMVTGMSGQILDNLFTLAGGPLNEALGYKVAPEAGSKYRHMGLTSVFGPAAGLATNTLWGGARNLVDGDIDKALRKVARTVPIINTIGIRATVKAFEAAGD